MALLRNLRATSFAVPLAPRPVADLLRRDDGAFEATGPAPRLALGVPKDTIGGRWIELDYEIATTERWLYPSLALVRSPGRAVLPPLDLPIEPTGEGRWLGRLPSAVDDLILTPFAARGTFDIRRLSLRVVGRPAVAMRAIRREPLATLGALALWLVGRRKHARSVFNRIVGDGAAKSYAAWVAAHDTWGEDDYAAMRAEMAEWTDPPLISVVMPVYNTKAEWLRAALASVQAQVYGNWQLVIADDASTEPHVRQILKEAAAAEPRITLILREANGHIAAASNSALEKAEGPFTAFMDHDDLLPAHALFFVARELIRHPDTDFVYTDEDKVDGKNRRHTPHFKSDWNEELFYTQNFCNHLSLYRTELLRRIGGLRDGFPGSQDHEMVLRFLDHTSGERIRHIPRILYHWRNFRGSGAFSDRALLVAVDSRRKALAEFCARRGIEAEVTDGPIRANRLKRRLPDPAPLVSVIVPTRDRAALLATCLRGVLAETDYPALEVIVVDNGSVEPETAALLAGYAQEPRLRVLARPGPFNFSALNNAAVAEARGELILMLNNDIEVMEPGWLAEMVTLARSPGVGIVGAKLLYPDRRVQHAGVILGAGGIAGHAFQFFGATDPGYFGRAVLPQYLSAVTGACLLVHRRVWEAVGGLDADGLAIAFNDIDLCLKARALGHKVAVTPYATLIHHESASRGSDRQPEARRRFEGEIALMLDRWGDALRSDPYYNPNLSLDRADFRLAARPRPR